MNEIIDIPVPETEGVPELMLLFGAGELNIVPGDADALVSGEVRYNDERFKPHFTQDGLKVTLRTGIGEDILGDIRSLWENRTKFENVWNLHIGTVPMDLSLRIGAAKSGLDLGNLSLRNLSVEQGATDLSIGFSQSNLDAMETFTFVGGASRSVLKNLGNTRAGKISFRGGAGDYTLDFSGAVPEKMNVTIEAGVGRVSLIVPETVGAVLVRKGGLTTVNAGGAWKQKDGMWVNGSEGMSEAHIRFTATMGLGALELRNG